MADVRTALLHPLMHIYAMRMAAVFMISTSTLLSRGALGSRALALAGYVIAFVLLIVVAAIVWAELRFPVWVMLVRLHILRERYPRSPRPPQLSCRLERLAENHAMTAPKRPPSETAGAHRRA